jgi:hypothetical protein
MTSIPNIDPLAFDISATVPSKSKKHKLKSKTHEELETPNSKDKKEIVAWETRNTAEWDRLGPE